MTGKKLIILVALPALLTGCANLKFQWSASYATENLIADLQRAHAAEQAKQPAGEMSK